MKDFYFDSIINELDSYIVKLTFLETTLKKEINCFNLLTNSKNLKNDRLIDVIKNISLRGFINKLKQVKLIQNKIKRYEQSEDITSDIRNQHVLESKLFILNELITSKIEMLEEKIAVCFEYIECYGENISL